METRKEKEPEPESADDDVNTGAPEDSPAADRLPGAPADDDSPLGDTDQHSDA